MFLMAIFTKRTKTEKNRFLSVFSVFLFFLQNDPIYKGISYSKKTNLHFQICFFTQKNNIMRTF